MIIVVVTHRVKAGMEEPAARRIDENGREMAAMPGFLFRYRASPSGDPSTMATYTGWRSEEDFARWNEAKSKLPTPPELAGDRLYDGVVREVLNVDAADDPADRRGAAAGE